MVYSGREKRLKFIGSGRLGQPAGRATADGHSGDRCRRLQPTDGCRRGGNARSSEGASARARRSENRDAAMSCERAHALDPNSAFRAYYLAAIYNQLGRVGDAISLLENGPPHWRSVPEIRLWLALSYALAGRKEQAAAEFTSLRALAPKFTVVIERQLYP